MKTFTNKEKLLFYTSCEVQEKINLPVSAENVVAGFPSPSENYIEGELDLNTHLIKNPPATFFVKVSGDSMINAGIHPGDILIVDKSLEANHNSIVIAALNGEFTVKRLYKKNGKIKLIPENKTYNEIIVEPDTEFEIWGIVTSVIHTVR